MTKVNNVLLTIVLVVVVGVIGGLGVVKGIECYDNAIVADFTACASH